MKNLSFLSTFLVLLFAFAACGGSNESEPATLSVSRESVDFKDKADKINITIKTNTDSWSATVDPNGSGWCNVTKRNSTSGHVLEVAVTENDGANIRETSILVSAPGVDSKTIKVRQLGYEKAVLFTQTAYTVDQIGGTIEMQITTNLENYNILTDDWITEVVPTKGREMVTTDHAFSVKMNTADAERVGYITVQDNDSEFAVKAMVTQKGMGSYTAAELDGIKDDIKVSVVRGEASSYQSGEGIEKSFDGDYNTIYHSNWTNSASNYFPITLTYYFNNENIDYMVYYPRTSGSNGHFKQTEIQAQYNGSNSFVKVMDMDFGGSGSATKVQFPEQLNNATAIRIIVKSGSGDGQGFAACSEMEFYEKNPDTFNPLELFTDKTCSELKPGITEEEINACAYPFYKKLAYYMFNNKYPREFRIAEFKAYPHPDIDAATHKTNAYSLLDNPAGISVAAGEKLVVFAGDLHGQKVSVKIQNLDAPGGDGFGGVSYPISEGYNCLTMQTKGLVYVMYHTPDFKTAKPIKLHFATGKVNGYFDVAKHSASDWNRLLSAACDQYFDVVGKYAHLTFPVNRFKANTPDGKALIDTYDEICRLEMDFMGLFKYDKVFNNRMYLNVMYHSYMYATSYHTGYNDTTLDDITDVANLKTGGVWGPAHEIGHCNQTRPGLLWVGTTEVTNNIHSLYVQTSFGNGARIQVEDLSGEGYTNRYEKAMSSILVKNIAHCNEGDVFCKLVPFWQLYLYCSKVRGNSDFYKDIYEDIRVSKTVESHGQNQLDFVYRCCKSSGLNLLDFFEAWGFFKEVNENIDDYGVKNLTVTSKMVTDLKAKVEALGYPKPTVDFKYITDNNASLFSNPQSVVAGTAKMSGNTITMTNWKNVAAYEVYVNNKLAFISPEKSFKVNGTNISASTTKVYAVSATGEKTEVKF